MSTRQLPSIELDQAFSWQGRDVRWGAAGSGPPIVFCHGTPWSSELWRPFAQALAADFTVHLWDMPGYGRSSKRAEHEVDLGVQGRLLADLVAHWGLDAPHVVAHDFGGAVTLRAHLLHGMRVSSLFLADVVALRPWGSPFFRLVAEHADVFGRLPAAVHRGAVEAYIRGASHHGLSESDLATLAEPWLGDEGQAAFYRQIAAADEAYTDEVEPLLGSIASPTHVVWGREDVWIPPDRAEALRAAIPGATLTLVPDAGHLIQLDAPAALASELRWWLGRSAAKQG